VVLAGRRVAGAFGLADISYCTIFFYRSHRFAIIPHPSGVNRLYNHADMRARVSVLLRYLLDHRTIH
jgi:hypothetical protein